MRRRTTAATAVLAAVLSTVAIPATADTGYTFRVLGERSVALDNVSGLDYSAATDEWYLISDGSPARFYGADLALTAEGLDGVTVNGATRLREADGTSFPFATDAEAIRVNPADGSLLWASEGAREVPRRLVDPTVRRANADGTFVAQHPTAPFHAASAGQEGVRDDRGLEALTLNTGGTLAVSATEGPLIQDGTQPVRVNFANRDNGAVVSQLVYDLDPGPRHTRVPNGLTEILAKDARSYLALERARLANGRHSVRLYEASTVGARSVLTFPSLEGTPYTPMTKRLLVDFADLGLARVPNLEGMAWGPTLPTGERTLVLVSDNECEGRTQLIALGVTLP